MPEPLQLLSAALVGLLGGVHCVGMCGGVVGALAFTLPPERRGSLGRTLPYLLAYNAGRITSYVVAGAAFGAVGAAAGIRPDTDRPGTGSDRGGGTAERSAVAAWPEGPVRRCPKARSWVARYLSSPTDSRGQWMSPLR